jgi:hypothetical protein
MFAGGLACEMMPRLRQTLADKAVPDLKPFATNAQKTVAVAISNFRKTEDGVRIASEITSVELAYIAFDSKRQRVIAEAEGSLNVFETALPGL